MMKFMVIVDESTFIKISSPLAPEPIFMSSPNAMPRNNECI
jgi:hypothetical protein